VTSARCCRYSVLLSLVVASLLSKFLGCQALCKQETSRKLSTNSPVNVYTKLFLSIVTVTVLLESPSLRHRVCENSTYICASRLLHCAGSGEVPHTKQIQRISVQAGCFTVREVGKSHTQNKFNVYLCKQGASLCGKWRSPTHKTNPVAYLTYKHMPFGVISNTFCNRKHCICTVTCTVTYILRTTGSRRLCIQPVFLEYQKTVYSTTIT